MNTRDRYMLLLVLVLSTSPWFFAAYTQWTSAFEATPAGGDLLAQGDDRIRELKENIRNRMGMEHVWGPSTRDNGHHAEGSANAWLRTPCRTADLTADPNGSASTYDTTDTGKLCSNLTDGSFQIWNGSAYVAAFGSFFNNTLGHYANGVAPVDTYDPTKFAIRNIILDATTDSAGCLSGGNYSTTALASQTFGDAGIACFTTGSINLSARSTTSRALIVAQVRNTFSSTTGAVRFAVYRDAQANQIGSITDITPTGAGSNPTNATMVAYVTGITAASHEFAISVEEYGAGTAAPVADPNGGSLIYIDLGPEYP